MPKSRLLMLLIVLIAVIMSALGGWVLGSNIISPAEAAARTAPPTPSPILVPIEERILTSDIVTRGTARFGQPQDISIVPSSLRTNTQVITWLPEQATEFQEGNVIAVIAGRPVFVLQGDIPVYRDLVPGLVGDDVLQLEEALQRLGYYPNIPDRFYDEQTSTAVVAWYEANDWTAFGATNEQVLDISQLEQELLEANNRLARAEDRILTASLAVETARATANANNVAIAGTVLERTNMRDVLLADSISTDADIELSNATLETALASEEAINLEGDLLIQEALNVEEDAELERVTATELVNQITHDLELARAESGISVPSDEIVFMSAFPIRVNELSLVVGDSLAGAVMTVTNNQLLIDSSLPLDEAPFIQPGMSVNIDEPNLGITATGIVSQVANNSGTSGVDGFHIYLEVAVDETPLTLEGFSLRLTIPIESTGDSVIVVPISALSLAADGTSRIQVEIDEQLETIIVEPGLASDGFVQITSVDHTFLPGQLVVIGFEG